MQEGLRPSLERLRRLAGEILAQVECGLAVEGSHGVQSRDFIGEEAISVREEQGSPRLKFLMQSGVPNLNVFSFPRSRDDGLCWRGKRKIERDKHLGNRCGHAIEGLPACSQDLPGAGFESFIVEHPCEAQEIQGADRVRRRLGAVVVFLQTERNQRIAGSTAEIAPSGLIPEKCVLAILQLQCPLQPIGHPTSTRKGRASLG